MKKKKIVRGILIILIIINCITIFKLSSEKAEQSSETSGKVIEAIIEANPKTRKLSVAEKKKTAESIVTPIRKTAHFTIYTSLGIWLYLCARTFEATTKYKIMGSIGFAFFYACTDEFHQRFVSGRSGEFRDVCIDTCGAIFGILLVMAICKVRRRVHKITTQ